MIVQPQTRPTLPSVGQRNRSCRFVRDGFVGSRMLSASLLTIVLATASVTASASADFVDSVHSWGTWELGLEPAAGAPAVPAGRTIRVQQRNVQFRPNENSAFTRTVNVSSSGPSAPPAPVLPPSPSGPITPGTPVTTGSPGDLF